MNIFTIVGARPNFLKIDTALPQTIVHTGQHYDRNMDAAFFEELKLPKPAFNLGCTKVGEMIDKLTKLFQEKRPDMVQVFGDTHSSLAGAVAAAHCGIRVAHIEAGLRSGKVMPEEVNRKIIDRISYLLFCPNEDAKLNLLREGIRENVFISGDPLADTMGQFLPIKKKPTDEYILLTLHRNFTVDNPEKLLQTLQAIASTGEKVIFLCHPRTKKNIKRYGLAHYPTIDYQTPKTYKRTLTLISGAKKVITDSGGIQREAFWMNKPLIILRDETEWKEIIEKGGGILVGTDEGKIKDAVKDFKNKISPAPVFGAKKFIKEIIYKHL